MKVTSAIKQEEDWGLRIISDVIPRGEKQMIHGAGGYIDDRPEAISNGFTGG